MRRLVLFLALSFTNGHLGCQTSRSAEREDSFAQQGETRTEAGPWTRETWDYAPQDRPPGVQPNSPVSERPESERGRPSGGAPSHPRVGRDSYGVVRHVVETHAPITTTSTTTVEASGEAKEARSARFGWSPWTIAVGLAVATILAYAAYRLKSKLPF